MNATAFAFQPGQADQTGAYDQLIRYAQDLSELITQYSQLQQRHQMVLQVHGQTSPNHNLLLAAINHSTDAYLVTDDQGGIRHASAKAATLLGQNPALLRTRQMSQLMPVAHRQIWPTLQSELASADAQSVVALRQLHLLTGVDLVHSEMFEALIMPVCRYDNAEIYWLLQSHTNDAPTDDVFAHLQRAPLQNCDQGMVIADAQGVIRAVNPAFSSITGYSQAQALGQNMRLLSSGLLSTEVLKSFWLHLVEAGSWSGEFINRRRDGRIYPHNQTVKAVKNAQGQTVAYLSAFEDASQKAPEETHLPQLAYHDPLTNLPNRLLLQDRLTLAMLQAQRTGAGLSVMSIDLDNFKAINDEMGHDVAVLVLQKVASRLKKCVRQTDTVARVGGDEFVLLLNETVRETHLHIVGHAILSELTTPMTFGEHTVRLSASIGCARYPHDGSTISALLKCAGSAMYQAKRTGANQLCLYATASVVPALSGMT